MAERVIVFDTTLRDGEQAGHKMSPEVKLTLAHKLKELGVDVIEAGFGISSPGDFAAIQKIAKEVRGVSICSLARVLIEDVDAAWQAIEKAEKPRIHTFIATSDVHTEKKLRMSKEQVIEKAVKAIERARRYCDDVEFSPEDSSRTSKEYLADVVGAAIAAGAATINIPDTVGYTTPWEYEALIRFLYEQVPDLTKVAVSVHCHNDLGLACANTLAGLRAGARQIEGCLLGIGERAGNVSLEQVIMALKTRQEFFGLQVAINTNKIGPTCRLLSNLIGYPIPAHQPIVGENAFCHSSGIHADGVIKERKTYEIITPESVGWEGKPLELVSHLGRAGLKRHLCSLGYSGEGLIEQVYPEFKRLADVKGKLTDEDLHMIVQELRIKAEIDREQLFDLEDIDYHPGWAKVKICRNGAIVEREGKGDGAISAIFNAIRDAAKALGENLDNLFLLDYNVVKGQGGSEANAWVVVRLRLGDRIGYARSGHPDTVTASAKAYLYALNHLLQVPVSHSANNAS